MLEDKLTYLGLCEGISTATVAWKDLMKPVGFAETDEFPSAVLKHHYPNTPNFGDITKYKEWKLETDPDLIIGGTPVSPFQSLDYEEVCRILEGTSHSRLLTFSIVLGRSGLFGKTCQEYFPQIKEETFTRSSKVFKQSGMCIGWRVLDAQYFGLAQRRKRVFVVGNNTGDIRGITEVLFEREGLLRILRRADKRGKTTRKTGESIAEDNRWPAKVSNTLEEKNLVISKMVVLITNTLTLIVLSLFL